jgi:hypothetical protein
MNARLGYNLGVGLGVALMALGIYFAFGPAAGVFALGLGVWVTSVVSITLALQASIRRRNEENG